MKNILCAAVAAVAALFAFGTAEAASAPSVPVQALCGIAGGVACLDQTGKVPAANLPAGSGNGISTGQVGAANGVAGLDANANVAAGNLGNLLAVKIISASTYTLSAADYHQALRFTSTSPTTVTVPASSSLPANFVVTIDVAATAGAVTFSTSGGTLINETTAVVLAAAEGGQIYVNTTGGNFSIRNLPFAAGSGLASAVSNGRRTLSVTSVSGVALDSGLGLSATGPVQRTGSGTYATMTPAQQTAYLNAFSSTLAGLVPASGGNASTYLNGAGAFTVPAGGGTSYTAGPGVAINSGQIALSNTPSAQKTTSYTLVTADNGQEVHFCATSDATATVPAIATTGFGYGTGYTIVNDKASSSGAACTANVTVSSATNIYGAVTGPTVTLTPGTQVNVAADSTSSYYTASYNTSGLTGGGSSYPALTSPNATLNISGSGTSAMTADVAVPALPLAGGTLKGQVIVATGTPSAPSIGTAGQTNSGLNLQNGIGTFYRGGSALGSIGPSVLFGQSATTIATDNNVNTTPLFELNYSASKPIHVLNGFGASVNNLGYECNKSLSNTMGTQSAMTNGTTACGLSVGGSDGVAFQKTVEFVGYADGNWTTSSTPMGAEVRVHPAGTDDSTPVKVWRMDSKYHEIFVTQGTVSAANWTGLGGSPTVATYSGDTIGSLTLGTAPSTSIALAFATGAFPNAPYCDATDVTQGAKLSMSATSTTGMTLKPSTGSGITLAAGDVVMWRCVGLSLN